nr:VWA domain-containing protein [Nocardioides albus]
MQLVLDSSGSMAEPAGGGGTKIDAARTALDNVVDTLPDEAEVGMRVYGATVDSGAGACTDSQEVVPTATDNRDELRAAIDDYKPLGETPIGYALQQAAKDLGSDGKRTIALVSDGEATCRPDPCKVAKALSKDGLDLRVDVVGLSVDAKARKQLRCIAEAGNGSYYDADSAEDMTDSLEVTSTRAFRPFRFTGTPVEGTNETSTAPTVTNGQYVDTYRGEDLHYRVERTEPGTTLHVSALTRSPDAATVSGLNLDLETPGRGLCGSSSQNVDVNMFGARALVASSATSWEAPSEQPERDTSESPEPDSCADGPFVYAALKLPAGGDALVGKPVELLVSEEPPLVQDTYADLPPAQDSVRWNQMKPAASPEEVVPGDTLSNAPVVKDGTYSGELLGGETQVVAVPVDWGQQLQAQVDVNLTDRLWKATGTSSNLNLDILGPDRTKTSPSLTIENEPEWWRDSFINLMGDDVKRFRTGATTPEIRYRNREEDTTLNGSRAGVRFIEINMSKNVKDGVAVPYTLTLQTYGEAGGGAPEYNEIDGLVTSAEQVGAPPSESTPETANQVGATSGDSADETDGTDGQGIPIWLPIGGGVAVLIVAGIVLAVMRARRSS